MMGNAVQFQSVKLETGAVPVGEYGLVHITARNNMQFDQELGVSWVVQDPDGVIIENFGVEWETEDPGEEHEFIGDRFPISKKGIYNIKVTLQMNRNSPVTVDQYDGVLCVATEGGLPISYKLIQESIFPYAYVYDGDVDVTTATFRTEPFTPSAWQAERLERELSQRISDVGGRLLGVKVYVDKTPLFWTDFKVEVTSTPLTQKTEAYLTSIAIPLVIQIVIAALAIIGVIVAITLSVKTIAKVFQHQTLSEDIKKAWSRETLVSVTHDFEEKLSRLPTPSAELEKLTDQELRDYCNELAAQIEKPGISWLPWMLVGGVAVLGIGTAAVISSWRK